jgi:phospholipid-translocating ATPase
MMDHQEYQPHKSCCESLSNCFCCQKDMNVERKIYLDGRTDPLNRISNAVNNQKYNLINFLPLVLFNQFKLFFNFFQLAINLSQLVSILKVGRY